MSEHTVCEPGDHRTTGCGHPLADHSDGMRCQICGRECGHLDVADRLPERLGQKSLWQP